MLNRLLHQSFFPVLLLLFGALAPSFAARAQTDADIGLVNQVSGDVTYAGEGGLNNKAQAFMRVRQGDRFVVAPGASLRLVYLAGGRQELFKGPAAFRAGATQSEMRSGAAPEVTVLPTAVPQKIARVPELLQSARLGGISVRGGIVRPRPALDPANKAEMAEARKTYAALRAATPEDDITPELFLFSVLQEFSLYDEIVPLSEDMQRRQPSNPELKELAAWVRTRAAQMGK